VTPPWKLVLDEAAFQFFASRPKAERRNLFHAFEQLRENRVPSVSVRSPEERERPVANLRLASGLAA
jgi:hypothetical protein